MLRCTYIACLFPLCSAPRPSRRTLSFYVTQSGVTSFQIVHWPTPSIYFTSVRLIVGDEKFRTVQTGRGAHPASYTLLCKAAGAWNFPLTNFYCRSWELFAAMLPPILSAHIGLSLGDLYHNFACYTVYTICTHLNPYNVTRYVSDMRSA